MRWIIAHIRDGCQPLLQPRRQFFTESRQRPQPQHPDRTGRAMHPPGDFLVRQIFEASQDDHLAMVGRQTIAVAGTATTRATDASSALVPML